MDQARGTAAGEAPGESLPGSARLKRRSEIKRVQDGGRRLAGRAIILMISSNTLGRRRLGVTVSSRVGNSVVRSRLKRRFREIYRKERARLPPAIDVVMIARGEAPRTPFAELREEFVRLAVQAGRVLGESAPAKPGGRP